MTKKLVKNENDEWIVEKQSNEIKCPKTGKTPNLKTCMQLCNKPCEILKNAKLSK